jgi:hypothetical protein
MGAIAEIETDYPLGTPGRGLFGFSGRDFRAFSLVVQVAREPWLNCIAS